MPFKGDKDHKLTLTLNSQNDLTRNAGFQIVELGSTYHWNPSRIFKNTLALKSHEWNYKLQYWQYFYNKKLLVKFSNEFTGHWNKNDTSFFNPSIAFNSSLLNPYAINGKLSGSSDGSADLSLGLARNPDESNAFGY